MFDSDNSKHEIELLDVLDWAYCPLRFWWRNTNLAPDVSQISGKKTGEALYRAAIRSSIKFYYDANKNDRTVQFGECLGLVWKAWLKNWGLSEFLARSLVDYQKRRRALLMRFENGAITNRDGDLYRRPTWTRHWRELSDTTGLTNLRIIIDNHQTKIGMGTIDHSDDEYCKAPIGLADAFANSIDISNVIKLPSPDNVIGVEEPMLVDLPSVLLRCHSDIVVELGKSRRVGRPSSKTEDQREIKQLECMILLFDESLPSAYSLSKDLRVIAFGQAKLSSDRHLSYSSKVKTITVYHLPSGKKQDFTPHLGYGTEILESLSRAVITGIRGGVYLPRMVCGWDACGDCEYRNLCFSGDGVMNVFNPPLMEQAESSIHLRRKMLGFIKGSDQNGKRFELLRSFASFITSTPGLSPQGALWMIDNLAAEQKDE